MLFKVTPVSGSFSNIIFQTFIKPLIMKKIFFFLSILGCFCFTTCKKDKPSKNLPPITQEGKNTIGFKVNGEVWTPYYECRYFGNPCGEIHARYGPPYNVIDRFSVGATRQNSGKASFLTISSLHPVTTTGNKYDSVTIYYTGENSSDNSDKWSKQSAGGPPGVFEITKIDLDKEIISGIFSFILYEDSGSGRTLEITDGRFDFKMNACICR